MLEGIPCLVSADLTLGYYHSIKSLLNSILKKLLPLVNWLHTSYCIVNGRVLDYNTRKYRTSGLKDLKTILKIRSILLTIA